MEKILILMSTYNGEKYISMQLDSILAQNNVETYLLVRDDGSTDRTVEILQTYASQHNNIEVLLEDNIGCVQSFLELLLAAYSKTEFHYYAFADQDDIWKPCKLQVAINALKYINCRESPCMYCSNLDVVDEQLQYMKLSYKRYKVESNKKNALIENRATGCTMVFNRCCVELFYKYRPKSVLFHDYWIYLMCVYFGQVYIDTNAYILYRQHGNNVVGVRGGFFKRWRKRIKNITNIPSVHSQELEAKRILEVYEGMLSETDRQIIEIVANYRRSWLKKVRLFICSFYKRGYSGSLSEQNLIYRYRILCGIL